MSIFTNYAQRAGEIEFQNGAKAIVRQATNGFLYVVQTHDKNGDLLPQFALSADSSGIFSGGPTSEPTGLWIPQNHLAFDFVKTQIEFIQNSEPVLSPESIAAGATLEDTTNATDTDKANIAIINQLRSLLGV